jgi:rod shape-determining protein MreC
VKAKKTVTFLAAAVAVIGASALVLSRSFALETAYPVERAKQSFVRKVVLRLSGLVAGAKASAENARLRREVAALSMLRGELERLESENARLRKALAYTAKAPGKWMAAGVLSRGGGAAAVKHSIRVDKGSLAGVAEGDVVAVPEGLVGRVSEVTLHTSTVVLVTDPSLKVSCELESLDTVMPRGILCGGSNDRLLLRYMVGAAGNIPARTRVLTSGLGGVFPKGIEVGTLLDVVKDDRGLASEGEVLPTVDYSTLEDVFIRRGK